jgi:hypothetical protein
MKLESGPWISPKLRLTDKPLKPIGHVMHQQFNIQQLYALPTLYLCVLCLSENKQRLVPLIAQTDWFLLQRFNKLKPSGHYMYHQFNIHQRYALPTLYLCVLYLPENKQRLVPLTA